MQITRITRIIKQDKAMLLQLAMVFVLLNFNGFSILKSQEKQLVLGDHETFKVAKAKNEITIDGKMKERDWKTTEDRSFDYFYRIVEPTDKQETTFRMLWDENNLYVFFACKDQYLTSSEKERDGKPYLDDCAEIFFIPAPDSLDIHFGFELNLYKAPNDFIYVNNFYKGQAVALQGFNPDYEMEVEINGTINNNSDIDKGWSMEFAIPLELFQGGDRFFPVRKGTQWAFLAARQDRNEVKGTRRSTSTLFPIYDMSKGVHQPSRFGLLEFVDSL